MRLLVGAGVMILLFSVSAFGQIYGNNVGGGPSLNSMASVNSMGSLHGVPFHPSTGSSGTQFHMSVAAGSEADFTPSVYVPFEKAVAEGRAELAAKPKTLAEVAFENKAAKRTKAELTLVQDDNGKLIRQTP